MRRTEPALLGPAREAQTMTQALDGQWVPPVLAGDLRPSRTRRCMVATSPCGSTSSVFSSMMSRLRVSACQARMSMTPRSPKMREGHLRQPDPASQLRRGVRRPTDAARRAPRSGHGRARHRATGAATSRLDAQRRSHGTHGVATGSGPPARSPVGRRADGSRRHAARHRLGGGACGYGARAGCYRGGRRPHGQGDDKVFVTTSRRLAPLASLGLGGSSSIRGSLSRFACRSCRQDACSGRQRRGAPGIEARPL